jgi:predicted alpha/beta hydrolase
MGALAALIVAGLVALPFFEMHGLVDLHVNFKKTYAAEDYGLAAEKLSLTTGDGLKLAAYRVDAENPRAVVIFVSGIHSPSVTAFFGHAAMLRKEGFSSLLVEMRAHGESEGDRICLGTKEVLDVQAAVQYLKGTNPKLPSSSVGFRWARAPP